MAGVLALEGKHHSQRGPPAVDIWFRSFTNQPGGNHEFAILVVSNASPFPVIRSDIYTVEVRTASGETIRVPHSFLDKPRTLLPHQTQLAFAYVWVTGDQESWKVDMTFNRDESYVVSELRKIRNGMHASGLPVTTYPWRGCRADTEWISERKGVPDTGTK